MKIIGESFAGVATAATRVIEMYIPEEQRLFDDSIGYKLLPFGWRFALRLFYLPGLRDAILGLRERRMPGSLGGILCRTRYIDDVLAAALVGGIEQVVILGAGFDTRAYRIEGMNKVRVFEVDLPGTGVLKAKRLDAVLDGVPENVVLVGMDFDRQDLGSVLNASGFQHGLPTFFIWEGVTQYITGEAVSDTLAFVSRVSGAGSAIVFTYTQRGLIDGTDRPDWFEPFSAFAERVGSPFIFGLDPAELAEYLSERGLRLIKDVGAVDYQELYLKPTGRVLNIFGGERAALAEVIGHEFA